jgi:DNA-binding CsgD family transcriptional regulator
MIDALDDAIDDILNCRDLLTAARVLRSMGDRLGSRWVAAVEDYSSPNIILAENGTALAGIFGWEADFIGVWVDKRLTLSNPVGQACRFATRPFAWHTSSIWHKWNSLTKAQQRTLDFIRRNGSQCGISIPVHRPRGRVGSVDLVHDALDLDLEGLLRRHSGQLMLFGHYFLDLVYRKHGENLDSAELTTLSEREIECLTWVALGKTDVEIGEIMGRSPTTARFHVEKAIKKLGATGRTQAAAMASQLGLIGPVV